MTEAWRGSTSAEMWTEIVKLRARAEAAEAERDALWRQVKAMGAEMGGVIARGIEQQERAVAAEARIAAALALCKPLASADAATATLARLVRAALVEPVGEPPRPLEHTPSPREAAAMEELVRESERLGLYRENYLTWDALRADVERLNVIPVEDCPSLDAVIVMMRERREHGHERALVPVHCYCWYERDEPCCHCGQTGPNLVVLSSAPPDPESETP